jgi:uncharacterized membrane protein YeaQ/YmgE (transglycosylase-associated protein family)
MLIERQVSFVSGRNPTIPTKPRARGTLEKSVVGRTWPWLADPSCGAEMIVMNLIICLIMGANWWLAGSLIMERYGFGFVGNIVVGVAGSVIAGRLLRRLGFSLRRPCGNPGRPHRRRHSLARAAVFTWRTT